MDSLLELTEGLEDLLNVLEDVSEEFKERFRNTWWELEFTVSCMIDNQQQTPSDEDQQAVDKALIKMETMIQNLIK
ncbi:MAG: hypothetical protein K940chlam8_01008 [Chlamydiae bacterium]|nr:hypothetical protein [Chlamydiota bacterium]